MNISRCKERNGLSLVLAPLYRQIDRENIRNRRRHEIEYIQGLIGMLDFVLSSAQWSELYSRMEFELDCRLEEAEKIGVGFTVPSIKVAPSAPRNCEELDLELVGQGQ